MRLSYRVFSAGNLAAGLLGICLFANGQTLTEEAVFDGGETGKSGGADSGSNVGFRERLEESGFLVYGNVMADFFANLRGGLGRGLDGTGLVEFGLEADLDSVLGWPGASFFTNAFYFRGNDLSANRVGDFNGISNAYTDTELNVFNIYFRKSYRDERIWWKAGQIAMDDDFMVAESSLLFINASFGPLPTATGNSDVPVYALAAPGALLYVEPDERRYWQTAVYAGDAGTARSGNHGFDWRTGGSAGWAWFGETGMRNGVLGGGVVKLGGYRATGELENFASGGTKRGLSGFYGILDQRILRGAAFGLSVFLRGGFTPDGEVATVRSYVDGGVVLDNIWLEEDALGFAFSETRFGSDYRGAMQAEGVSVTGREWVLEASYRFNLSDRMTIQPDLQWVLEPHFSGKDAWIAGVRAELVL